jgi:hypothetical protein
VIVVYDNDQIVLYNIPSDCFRKLQKRRSATDIWDENAGVIGQSDLAMDALMDNETSSNHERSSVNTDASESPTPHPLRVPGVVVANAQERIIDGLAVKTEFGGLSLWIFYREGTAELYSVLAPEGNLVRKRYIAEDGMVYDVADEDGTELGTVVNDCKHVKWAGQDEA